MSAYSKGGDGQVISLPNVGNKVASEGVAAPAFQPLPKVGAELEAFLVAAKQNESALLYEKQLSRKYKEEGQELQVRCSRLHAEIENARREVAGWEDRAKSHASAIHQQEKLFQERIRDLSARVEELEGHENFLKRQAQSDQLGAARLQQQVTELKQKDEKATVDYRKIKGEATELKAALHKTREELRRYQAAWSQIAAMDRKAKDVLREFQEIQVKLEKTREELAVERRHREKMEEIVKKERREKEIALSCLQTAEDKLDHFSGVQADERIQSRRSYVDQVNHELPELDPGIKLDL